MRLKGTRKTVEIIVFVEHDSKVFGYSLTKQKIKETEQSFIFPKLKGFIRLKKANLPELANNYFLFDNKKYFLNTPENREYYENYNEYVEINREYNELLKNCSKKVIEYTKEKKWNEGIKFYKTLNKLMEDLIGKKTC